MKKTAVLLTIMLIITICFPAASLAAQDGISITVDGRSISSDVAPVMEHDRVLIPLRAVGEALHLPPGNHTKPNDWKSNRFYFRRWKYNC